MSAHVQVVMFDRAFRLLLPALMWPSLVIGMILIGMQHNALGKTIIFGGFALTIVVRTSAAEAKSTRRSHLPIHRCWPAGLLARNSQP